MTLTTNQQLDKIQPSAIRVFDQLFRSIEDCILTTIGEPDFSMPEHVKDAAIKAIQEDESHYSHSMGAIGVRQAVADYLKRRYQLDYNPESEILMTVGATEAISTVFKAILNPGEKIIVPTPGFPLYKLSATIAYGETIEVNTSESGFLLTADQIHQVMADHDDVKAIVLNYPSNPTGVTYTPDELQALAEAIRQYEVFVISDEIYSELTYDQEHLSIARLLPEQTILISGASKAFAMTGWRVGFIATQEKWLPPIFKTHQMAITTGVTVSYKAAEEAFNNGAEAVALMKAEYEKRRDYCVGALTNLGFELAKPSGAFYLFIKLPQQFGKDDQAFCRDLAEKGKVGLIPGSVFGPGGEGYVRMSYALSQEGIEEAMKRITNYMGKSE